MVRWRALACLVIPLVLLGGMVARPSALMTLPSLVVDLAIGIIIILPIVAIRMWRSPRR